MVGPPFDSQLKVLPPTRFPSRIDLFAADRLPRRFRFHYPPNSFAIGGGSERDPPTATLELAPDERVVHVEAVSKVVWKEAVTLVVWIRMRTNTGRQVEVGDASQEGRNEVHVMWEGAGVKGCFGMFGDAIDAWGVIWGRS